ncbi:MAG: site-specific integrase [Rhodospirillales bacterium]|nr:site-specific integrase [Rhodospirillales bacterium]
MARTVRDAKLESRTARAGLKVSGKPYWRAIEQGLHLGYRKGVTGGRWVLRQHVGGAKVYEVETIGTADDTLDPDGAAVLSFAQAQAVARRRFTERKRIAAGFPAEAGPYRVRDAVADYLAWLDQNRKSGRDARWRADALILPTLGAIECAKLTTKVLRDWLDGLAKEAPRLRTRKGKPQRRRAIGDDDPDEAARRRRASANRVLTIAKAALNHAWRERKIASDDTWRRVQPFKEADAARVRYLTTAECTRLLNAADPEFRPLAQAALLTGCRFGELAALAVGDFNPDAGTLHIRTSKSGKARHVVLTEEGTVFFRSLAAGRPAAAIMLPKAGGSRWNKSHQTRPMKEACQRAKIEPPANFHALRHTWASLAVMGGAPLLVIAKNLGHSDTRMVERHYGHMAPSYVADAIRAAVPTFGIKADGNVVGIG